MGSSQTRARTHVPCIGRRILNHCATREVLCIDFFTDVISRVGILSPLKFQPPHPAGLSYCGYHMVSFHSKPPTHRAGVESRQPWVALSVCSANTSVRRNLTKVPLSACLGLCMVPVQGKVMSRSPFCMDLCSFFKSWFEARLPWPSWPDEMPCHALS